MNALAFEAPAPTAAVLTGVLLPSSGPLTAWAPVWSILQADGSLKETQTGGWTGPRPAKWLKVVKPGFVIGGFRVLMKIGAETVQTRQAQIFWAPWSDGGVSGSFVTSRVYGQAAGQADQVKIIELKLPGGAVPIGLYGETAGGSVVQVSLIVKQAPRPAALAPSPSSAPTFGAGPSMPQVPTVGPSVPSVPPVVLGKP